jgi:hypothetical protein
MMVSAADGCDLDHQLDHRCSCAFVLESGATLERPASGFCAKSNIADGFSGMT